MGQLSANNSRPLPRLGFGGETQDFVIFDSGEQFVETAGTETPQRLLQQHQILKVEASTGIVTLGAPSLRRLGGSGRR